MESSNHKYPSHFQLTVMRSQFASQPALFSKKVFPRSLFDQKFSGPKDPSARDSEARAKDWGPSSGRDCDSVVSAFGFFSCLEEKMLLSCSIYLSIHPSVYLVVWESIYIYIYIYIYTSICLPVCLSVCPSVCPSLHPSINPSMYFFFGHAQHVPTLLSWLERCFG